MRQPTLSGAVGNMDRPTGPWHCTCATHTSNLSDEAALGMARILFAVRQREAAAEAEAKPAKAKRKARKVAAGSDQ